MERPKGAESFLTAVNLVVAVVFTYFDIIGEIPFVFATFSEKEASLKGGVEFIKKQLTWYT